MNIWDSYIEAGQELPQKDKEAFYTALIEYLYYGVEPEITGAASAVFTAIRPSVDLSKARSETGKRGGNAKARNARASKQKPVLPPSKPPSKTLANEVANEVANSVANTQANEVASGLANEVANGLAKNKNKNNLREKEKEKYKEKEKGNAQARFEKPSAADVSAYAAERGFPDFDAEHFVDYYESNGWKVGRNPMRDWKACVRRWLREERPEGKGAGVDYSKYDR